MQHDLANELIAQAIHRMEENTSKIEKCLQELKEVEIWQRPNPSSNSIGNLILHLCGNITQYILSGLGEIKDTRERDIEFSTQGGLDKKELLDKLISTVSEALDVIKNFNTEDMLKKRSVQGFDLSAIGIIIHVVEHYSYHTGQIIFWTKLLKGKDLAFYGNVDLNKKNVT